MLNKLELMSAVETSITPTDDKEFIRVCDLRDVFNGSLSNNAGHVKVRFENLSQIGFSKDVGAILPMRNATATVSPYPTTIWNKYSVSNGINSYEQGFFIQGTDATADRIRESGILGQETRWRVAGNFSNKEAGNMGELRGYLANPDSGFRVSDSASLLAGQTEGDFTIEFTSISDENSLGQGKGYQLGFLVSFDDENLTITVNSIVRFDEAVEIMEVV